jgi:hypothetical protein
VRQTTTAAAELHSVRPSLAFFFRAWVSAEPASSNSKTMLTFVISSIFEIAAGNPIFFVLYTNP